MNAKLLSIAIAAAAFALGWSSRGSSPNASPAQLISHDSPAPVIVENPGFAPGRGVKDPEDLITPLRARDPAALVTRTDMRPGPGREADDVVTPLNVRDPTALVMSPAEVRTRCEPQAPPPWEVKRWWNASSAPTQPRG